MNSKNSTNVRNNGHSFIEVARRSQITEAATDAIALYGYAQASLAKIAEHANISTSLILYHFKDKDELMAATLDSIITQWEAYAATNGEHASSTSQKLRSYIETRLVYLATHPKQSIAMVDLLFSLRNRAGAQAYRTQEKGFELSGLVKLLEEGQERGEFKKFNPTHMAIMIRSTIDQFLGYSQEPSIDVEKYAEDLLAAYGTLIGKRGTL